MLCEIEIRKHDTHETRVKVMSSFFVNTKKTGLNTKKRQLKFRIKVRTAQ